MGILSVKLDSIYIYDLLILTVLNVSDEKLKTYYHSFTCKKFKYFSESSFISMSNHHTFCVFTTRSLNHCQSSILKGFDCKLLPISNVGKEHRCMWKVNK